ncbi:MAG TPA: flagellar basal body rod protein FlgC [Gammaproteobacteria bacterium]|nr:flagellar basal body rod protein FlgC [Gammaproteobacteria bacterium]
MSLFNVFDISGTGMNAQSVRLNVTASNIANADTVAGSPDKAYRARQPVFATVLNGIQPGPGIDAGVEVRGIVESQAELPIRYAPDNPYANEEGYIYESNVNLVEEMTNMISASRSYQNNIEVLNTSKTLLLQTLRLGE